MTRIAKLRTALPKSFGAALVMNDYNRAYLSGFRSTAGALVITGRRAVLFADSRYIEAARAAVFEDVEAVLLTRLYPQIKEFLSTEKIHTLYIENQTALADFERQGAEFPDVELVTGDALSSAVKALRAIKEDSEIAAIKAAQAITDAAFTRVLDFMEPGRTEREVAAELEYTMRKLGADGFAFPTICVAGVKSSMPHGEPGGNILRRGDFVTLDFGAMKDGYCSDMTRTVALGHITEEQRRVYDTVLAAHLAAMDAAHAGMTGTALDAVARDLIGAAGYEDCFGHGLGHSLGLEIHEEPRASYLSDEVLPPGTVITIEPGIYLEGRFGVRIENMVALREDGCDNLTASPRELMIL